MNVSLEPARRNLATAAQALDEFRRLSGTEASAQAPPSGWRVPAETGARAALDEARARLAELGAELDKVRRDASAAAEAASTGRLEASRAAAEAAGLRARAAELDAEWKASREALEAEAAAAREALEAGSTASRAALAESDARARRAEDDAREAAARLELVEREALSAARAEAARELAETKARAAALEADLEAARGTAAALETEAGALRAAAESRASSRADSLSNAEGAQRRAAAAESRVLLLEAECVRLQSMRRGAEQAAADSEAQGRAVAEALRGELRVVHAALDRAAVETGAAEARAKTDAEPILKRLEAATARVQALERERRLDAARGTGESSAVQTELLRAQAVAASLRQELSGARVEAETLRRQAAAAQAALERAVADRPAELERALAAAQALEVQLAEQQTRLLGAQAASSMLRHELSGARAEGDVLRRQTAEAQAALERAVADRPAEMERALAAAQAAQAQLPSLQMELLNTQSAAAALRQDLSRVRAAAAREEEALHRRFTEAQAVFERTLAERTAELESVSAALQAARAPLAAPLPSPAAPAAPPETAPSAEEEAAAPAFVSPALDPVLDPGWSRLLRLVRPPVDAAYAHLRRLSATAQTPGQKALLRMAAASIVQASDALSSIELSLEEGPAPGAAAPVLPVLESSLAAWDASFRGRGVALAREFSKPLPEAVHDPKELRLALHHVLRNTLEALPRGSRLAVRAARGPDGGLRLEFVDDGPGFPAEWLERRFEPFAAPRRGRAGLGLSIVRRTLRRWGGDAEASNGPSNRGARLALLFAPPPSPEPPSE